MNLRQACTTVWHSVPKENRIRRYKCMEKGITSGKIKRFFQRKGSKLFPAFLESLGRMSVGHPSLFHTYRKGNVTSAG